MTTRVPERAHAPVFVARDVMHKGFALLSGSTSLLTAWDRMRTAGVEHAVVEQDGSCLGVVTLQALTDAWSLGLVPLASRTVLAVVTPAPCVDEDTAAPELCRVLLQSRFGAAMVLDVDGRLLGLVTTSDVLAFLARDGGTRAR